MGKQWARQQAKKNELGAAVEKVALWLRYHPQAAIWGGVSVLGIVILAAALLNRQNSVREESWSKFAIAQSYAYSGKPGEAMGQIKNLTEQFPVSTAAGFASLLAGDILFQQKKYEDSAAAYQQVINNPSHKSLTPLAAAGLTLSEEAKGDCQKASTIGQNYLTEYEDHFLAPQVHASVARCLSSLGQPEKARATYERMGFLYPNTYWAEWAIARKG